MRSTLFAALLAAGVALSLTKAQHRATIVPSPAGRASPGPAPAAPALSPPVIIKRREVPVPQPRPVPGRGHIMPDSQSPNLPNSDIRGARFQGRPAQTPPRQTTIVRNPNIVNEINRLQIVEVRPNIFFWHRFDGFPYCHYHDSFGLHWYGFYSDTDFYWTRYYAGRWWWYDPSFQRWVFWWDGYWWWQAPRGGMYAYMDNNYYPYRADQGGVTVLQPQIDQPPPSPPASTSEGSVYNSPDGKHFVQIRGARREAFLYERRGGEPSFLKYLAKDVSDARFSGGGDKPVRLRLNFTDGSFAVYDSEGNPIDG